MDNNIRIFHSDFSVTGFSTRDNTRTAYSSGECTFVVRRRDDDQLDVAVSFCHDRDTFKKKDGIRIAKAYLAEGNYTTLPVNRRVNGRALNNVIREFMSRAGQDDFRHICCGTISNIPIKDWEFISFSPRLFNKRPPRICQLYRNNLLPSIL